MISSTRNARVKHAAELLRSAKARREQGLFIVEGTRIVSELPRDMAESIYVSESFLAAPENESFLQALPFYETTADFVFAAMSDTKSPQGVLAVVRQPSYRLEDLLKAGSPAHLVLLEHLQDPGNLGTILRAGEGAGITGLIMSRDTVDIYNPKVIRSTMGSVFRVPFLYAESLADTASELKRRGVCLYAAHLLGDKEYEKEDYTADCGFLIGNEAGGLSEGLTALADKRIRIPMAGRVESLNAAVAASVLMFEAARQRRCGSGR